MSEPDRITAHTTESDHEGAGLALLPRQFRGRPVLEAVLRSWLAEVQATEDALWSLYALGIDESSGAALDQIGTVLGQARPAPATPDAAYRRLLRAAVVALTSSGTGPQMIAAMRAAVGSYGFTVTEAFPAHVLVEPTAHDADLPASALVEVLRRVKSAGVGLQLVDVPAGDTFAFGSDSVVPTADMARGFESIGPTGGKLVGVVV